MLHGFAYIDLSTISPDDMQISFLLKIRWFLRKVPIHLKLLKLNQSIQTWNWSVVWLFRVMYTCTLTQKGDTFRLSMENHLFLNHEKKKHSLSSTAACSHSYHCHLIPPEKKNESLRGIHQTSHTRHKISYLTWRYATSILDLWLFVGGGWGEFSLVGNLQGWGMALINLAV